MASVDRFRWVNWLPLSGFGAMLTLLLAPAILILPGHEGVWITNAIISALESSSGRSPVSPDGPELGAVGYSEPSLIFATDSRVVTGVEAPLVWIQERADRWLLADGSLGTLPENLVLERQIRGYCIPEGKAMDLRLIRPQ